MKIGLALGAGAARGWTHIGIIQALEKLGIKIDVVAGCSIGAYVGAAYSSGKLDELKEWACSLSDWQVLALMGVGLRRGGLASGQKVFDKLASDFCADSFEAMNKPFAAVATDLYTGREVVFDSGPVGTSIQASCAIPALFSPVAYNDRWLVDGAVVNPVPVNLCRQLGADFVIAVKGNPPGILSVMSSSLEILQARVTRSRLAGDPPDILIEPQLTDVGIMEFHRAEELCIKGEETITRLAEQIRYQLLT